MTTERALVDLEKVRTDTTAGWLEQLLGEGMTEAAASRVTRDEWVLDFGYARPPISPNGSRGNHHTHARKVRDVRTVATYKARSAKIPTLPRIRAELTWFVRDRIRRDPVNLALVLKAMVDGLVTAGIVTDDTPDLVDTPMPTIVRVDATKNPEAWMELRVTPWEGLA